MVLGLVAVLLLGHFAVYGFHHLAATGRRVRRYRTVEVALHAVLALSFVAAWASATYLVLAKHVLGSAERPAPVPLGHLASTAHIGAGVAFLAALVALGVLWRPAMRFAAHDREWLRVLGGYFSRTHRIVPAGRFNAGQKLWFRLLIPAGVLLSVSGALLYYPAWLGVGPAIAFYVVHTALAVFVSAAVVGHVYLGAVVHPHAVRGMVTGEVDEACLREDHPLEAPGSRAA
jgi:formate dehydrogenase subunit gamma